MKKFSTLLLCILLIATIILTGCAQIVNLAESAIRLELDDSDNGQLSDSSDADSNSSSALDTSLSPVIADSFEANNAMSYIMMINNGFVNKFLPTFNSIEEIDTDFVIGLCFLRGQEGVGEFATAQGIENAAKNFINPSFSYPDDYVFEDLYDYLMWDDAQGGYTWYATGGSYYFHETRLISAYKTDSGNLIVNTAEYMLEGDSEYMWNYADILVNNEIVGEVRYEYTNNDMQQESYYTFYIDEAELPMYTYELTAAENNTYYVISKTDYEGNFTIG